MATKVHMEALSPTMEEGQVVKWLKQEGDSVDSGDVLAEIETDKATMELVARGAGVLRKQLLAEGSTAPVGAVIGVIAEEDEDISELLKEAPAGAGEPAHEPDEAPVEEEAAAGPKEGDGDVERAAGDLAASGREERAQVTEGVQAAAESPKRRPTPRPEEREPRATPTRAAGGRGAGEDGGRVRASPLARRLARESGIELADVPGSGPGGRIVKRDIESALETGAPAPAPAAAPAPAPPILRAPSDLPEVEEVPVTQMRKTIARRLVTSIGPVPTFYLTTEVDMGRMMAVRQRINGELEPRGDKVSVNDLLIKALAAALRRHPEVNASWQEDVIERYGRVHIGVAVAVEDGLITPVVRDADRKSVVQVSAEVKEMAGRARQKRLQPDEYTGATFSISNLGMFGIDEFTAIINPPESGILAVGRVQEKPVAEAGEVVVRQRMRMTMSCDHRVVDGATGARFLQTLGAFLEEPALMAL